MNDLLEYYAGDDYAAGVWQGKYAYNSRDGSVKERTPDDMHLRMAREFWRIEQPYNDSIISDDKIEALSTFGRRLELDGMTESDILDLLKDYKYVIPQGSIMAILGNYDKIGSLSNCFIIPISGDSYGAILKADEELVQLMKRRGGVGLNLNSLRPIDSIVTNSAGTSTGAPSFMDRYSNSTREVAQGGRRGALMLLLSCLHPDVFKFVRVKEDLTKVTGANISVMLTDEFMRAVKNDADFICRFPVDAELPEHLDLSSFDYNQIIDYSEQDEQDEGYFECKVMKIRAKELYDLIIEMAHKNAEPGVAFIDNIHNYSPDSVYDMYKAIASNPCFHPNTLIETVKGKVRIKDIKEPTLVYSMDKEGKLCLRKASASFISKRNTRTLKISLRCGSTIEITPEHKMFVHDKGWVEAKDLQLGDRIAHLSRSRRGAHYSGVYLTTDPLGRKGQVMEHRFVIGSPNNKYDVHHKDRNTYNNSIDNLEVVLHEQHSKITALEDNPQIHQVVDKLGRFVSRPNSRKGKKTITPIPDHFKTGMKNQWSNTIVSIENGEITDVYDIQVEDTHCLIANNMVAHNCGEQWFSAYDACRLLAINLFSFVSHPYTKKSKLDFEKLYEVAYLQQRLADHIVSLEIEYIDRILEKIKNDPEEEEVKRTERLLWEKVKNMASKSRRTGCGFTAMGDMLAALGLKYDSDKAIKTIKQVMKVKMKAELDCSIDLAIRNSPFYGWDKEKEFEFIDGKAVRGKNAFYDMLVIEFPEEVERMNKHGRRNISMSTVAPTGSVSIVAKLCKYANTTSGIEPLFYPFYFRNKKVNANEAGVRVDFVDQNGDSWTTYPIIMGGFKEWYDINPQLFREDGSVLPLEEMVKHQLEQVFENSPYYGSCADDINWEKRVEIQSVVQKYTTNAISSTINLPEDISKDVVAGIYFKAWKLGLKGVTAYRSGSRTGVLVKSTETKSSFTYKSSVKRPKELNAHLHIVSVKGVRYGVIIGLLDNNPYEVFAFSLSEDITPQHGKLIRVKKRHYDFECEAYSIQQLQDKAIHNDEQVLTRLVSALLRHGCSPTYVIEQIDKCNLEVVSYGKAISRILKKYVKEEELLNRNTCSDCGSSDLRMQEGCLTCNNCGGSKCG